MLKLRWKSYVVKKRGTLWEAACACGADLGGAEESEREAAESEHFKERQDMIEFGFTVLPCGPTDRSLME